jgi:hypothetical protein
MKTQGGWKEDKSEERELPPINIVMHPDAINKASD